MYQFEPMWDLNAKFDQARTFNDQWKIYILHSDEQE